MDLCAGLAVHRAASEIIFACSARASSTSDLPASGWEMTANVVAGPPHRRGSWERCRRLLGGRDLGRVGRAGSTVNLSEGNRGRYQRTRGVRRSKVGTASGYTCPEIGRAVVVSAQVSAGACRSLRWTSSPTRCMPTAATSAGVDHGEPDAPLRQSWGEVHTIARRMAGALADAGIGSRDARSVSSPPCCRQKSRRVSRRSGCAAGR